MKLSTSIALLAISLCTSISNAQDSARVKKHRAGQLYFSWGYNRDWYSASTIHFVNNNPDPLKSYDFTLVDAAAHDKPDMEGYWNLDRLTIPQYDFTIGYQFNDKHDLGVEINWNHLKYVVTDWQNVRLKGQIHGTPIDRVAPLDPDTVHLQHTNGNNYLLVNVTKRVKLLTTKHLEVGLIAKAGAGPLISYTISSILLYYDPGYFHYHGWVVATSVGVRASFLKYLFIQSDMQGAFANYTNTTMGSKRDGISTQTFYSLQWTWEGGVMIPIGKK